MKSPPAEKTDAQKQAVVLSGGGAYGAYEIGIMKALCNGSSTATDNVPLDAQIFTGTSVGALNAAFMTSQPETEQTSTIEQLENIWLNLIADNAGNCGNGVFRFRGSPFDFLDPICVLNHPLTPATRLLEDGIFLTQDLLKRTVNFAASTEDLELRTIELFNIADLISVAPLQKTVAATLDLKAIRRSNRLLRIAATCWDTGELIMFANTDFNDERGHQIIMASAAIPGIFPPVRLASDTFVDGGVLMNTPLLPAIRAGADVIHIVYLDPNVKDIPLRRLQNTIDTVDRLAIIQWAAKANEDIETIRWINLGIAALQKAALASEKQVRDIVRVLGRFLEKTQQGEPYKPITVHRYHPKQDLGGPLGMLNFGRGQIERLIEKGISDAINHDCAESECVFPSGEILKASDSKISLGATTRFQETPR
jgi:predicted acylesterase/phospholipase RssA